MECHDNFMKDPSHDMGCDEIMYKQKRLPKKGSLVIAEPGNRHASIHLETGAENAQVSQPKQLFNGLVRKMQANCKGRVRTLDIDSKSE